MPSVMSRLLRAGQRPTDDEDERLRKFLLVLASAIFAGAGIFWGGIYWLFGEPVAAAIPWIYSILSAISIGAFAMSGAYRWFAVTQFGMFVALPFALMWWLGGFVNGSVVGLWAALAPIAAILLGHRRESTWVLAAFAFGVMLTPLIQPALRGENHLPPAVIGGLFALNLVGVPAVGFALVSAFSGDRGTALTSMRSLAHRFLSADVTAALLADPARQELGGREVEVSIMFADLSGYTGYAEHRAPSEVVALLNRYFAIALPCISDCGGTPVQLPGDAVMAVFGAPSEQPDHAARASRAAIAIQAATASLAEGHGAWPRFRIGVNSGPALVGNIGSEAYRNFTAIGETTNLAQRLETLAEPGQVVIGPTTAALLGPAAMLRSLGPVSVKGKAQSIEPFVLEALAPEATAPG